MATVPVNPAWVRWGRTSPRAISLARHRYAPTATAEAAYAAHLHRLRVSQRNMRITPKISPVGPPVVAGAACSGGPQPLAWLRWGRSSPSGHLVGAPQVRAYSDGRGSLRRSSSSFAGVPTEHEDYPEDFARRPTRCSRSSLLRRPPAPRLAEVGAEQPLGPPRWRATGTRLQRRPRQPTPLIFIVSG